MDDKQILIKFGKRIKYLRGIYDISQEELAFRAGVHRTYIGMIERAEKNITLLSLYKIATAFNISLHDLLIFEDQA